jgi:hypothetical protein
MGWLWGLKAIRPAIVARLGTAAYKLLLLRQLLWAHILQFMPELALDELI